ncbi:MAG: hypothetical protein FD129_1343 [bacterium]|nr:MAG: hypothetical protein FD129_1343 [bacterium]
MTTGISAGGGHARHATEAGADHHADGGDFILGLHEAAAHGGEFADQRLHDLRRRRDRVAGEEAETRLHGAARHGLVAGFDPARGRLDGEARQHGELGAAIGVVEGGTVGIQRLRVFREALRHFLVHRFRLPAERAAEEAQAEHVLRLSLHLEAILDPGERVAERGAVGRAEPFRHLPLVRRVDDQRALRMELHGALETFQVGQAKAEDQVGLVSLVLDFLGGEAEHHRRLTAADLRAVRLHHHPEESLAGRQLQEKGAHQGHAVAAAADDGHDQRGGGCSGSTGRFGDGTQVRGASRHDGPYAWHVS